MYYNPSVLHKYLRRFYAIIIFKNINIIYNTWIVCSMYMVIYRWFWIELKSMDIVRMFDDVL